MAILALGDCNTLGAGPLAYNCYPERLGRRLGREVKNCGFTMATTREAVRLFDDHFQAAVTVITIQFGLVDSYRTFKYAPYVLYYPDNPVRKQVRSLVKQYKKLSRRLGLNDWLGDRNVVALGEYRDNIEYMVGKAANARVFLLETVPNRDLGRNAGIRQYNEELHAIAKRHKNCQAIALYDDFLKNLEGFYQDATHINGRGHDFIAEELVKALSGW